MSVQTHQTSRETGVRAKIRTWLKIIKAAEDYDPAQALHDRIRALEDRLQEVEPPGGRRAD